MKKQDSPNVAVETFLSLCKWFLIILVGINIIWALVFTHYVDNSFSGTTMSAEMNMESGTQNNNQSIANGEDDA